jgi:hypothetical protein
MIYTAHYLGKQVGKSWLISPTESDIEKLPLFTPSEKLINSKDESAQQIFREEMASKDQFIDVWIGRVKGDVTLNYCENTESFCHIVGEIIKSKRLELWGGEIGELEETTTDNGQSVIVNSRPTKLISKMTWGEILGQEYTAVFDNQPPLPEIAVINPWKVNVGRYAVYGGDVVKIAGGDRKGEWQLERSPNADPSHNLPSPKQWVKTSALTQPPKGHETWIDADFKKARKAS